MTKIFGQEDDIVSDVADIQAEVDNLDGDAMRGTDSAALASSWTATLATVLANYTAIRAGYLDQLDFDLREAIALIPTTAMRGTDFALLAANYITERGTDNATLQATWTDAMAIALAYYTAERAGYLDNINNTNLATIANISTLTATNIAYLNELAATNLPSDIDTLILSQAHDTFIFPDDTSLTCTLTAGGTPNIFGNWIEIVDSTSPTAITFTSKFASNIGHITGFQIEDLVEDEVYHLEISYGGDKTQILSHRFVKGSTKKTTLIAFIRIRSDYIPTGEILYYRMMCSSASETCEVSFRYHFH